ncbi:MAG TPA: peptidylprolyl isomerase [Symbiobacteriaceae bacterium]|nr:peptidylprolyl isomerase [Symbiobacteriaceae bacterium]
MKKRSLVLLVALLALVGCTAKKPTTPSPGTTQPAPATQEPTQPKVKQWKEAPAMQIDPAKKYNATIKTSLGDMTFELWPNLAPKTVNNFVFLSKEKFYDGVVFHRIIKDFMVQTGDPTGTGKGSPGYRFNDELPVKNSYVKGTLAMANSGPNTQGSQFFICTGPSCQGLDNVPNYTQFGKLTAGEEILDKIASVEVVDVEVAPGKKEHSKPATPPKILSVDIQEVK